MAAIDNVRKKQMKNLKASLFPSKLLLNVCLHTAGARESIQITSHHPQPPGLLKLKHLGLPNLETAPLLVQLF